VIAGKVDRLLVDDERVLVVDYKTGRAPAASAEIPASHLAQMSAYVDALSVIFPGRRVEAALLYTASATLFELAG
jgi:ATP-dependent helicase/nuclease subunit A